MAYLGFDEFPDLIEYYTTIGNGTLLKEDCTTIRECTILKGIEHFMYLTQSYFSDDTPNQILHIMSTLLLFSKRFYTTDTILPVVSLYSLRSINSTTQTLQLKHNNQTGSTLVLWTILLPLLQVQNSLEVLVF